MSPLLIIHHPSSSMVRLAFISVTLQFASSSSSPLQASMDHQAQAPLLDLTWFDYGQFNDTPLRDEEFPDTESEASDTESEDLLMDEHPLIILARINARRNQ